MGDTDHEKESDQGGSSEVGWGILTPAGWDPIWIAWSERGLRRLGWSRPDQAAPEATRVAVPSRYAEPLLGYFAGEPVDLNALPIDPIGTVFQRKVWAALQRVSRGTVRTYAGIASDVGSPRAMRAVGAANGANPIAVVVPCHRIVEAGMKLGGYSGGLDRKRRLLELEGARISGDVVQPGQLTLL